MALRIATIHERQVSIDDLVPRDKEVWRYGCYKWINELEVPADAVPDSAAFVLDESLPMSPEWTVFVATLGYLTKCEIDALRYLTEQSDWLIDDAYLDPVPLTATSSAEPFTKEAVAAGMECNICTQEFAYFALSNHCHPAVKTYLCHHVFGAACLQAWMDTDIENADKCPLCRTDMLMYKWPAAVKPLADGYRDFFKNGRDLDARIDAFLKEVTPDDAQTFHDPHWVRLLYDMHDRANALERLTLAFEYECEKYWESVNPEGEDDMSD